MRIRRAPNIVSAGSDATLAADRVPRRDSAPAIPPEGAFGPRGHPAGRARQGLRGPRDRRGVRGRRQGPAAGSVAECPALLGGEPAPLRLLAGAARAEGPQRLPALRPAPT